PGPGRYSAARLSGYEPRSAPPRPGRRRIPRRSSRPALGLWLHARRSSEWPVRPGPEGIRDVVFLVLQVSEQVRAQLLQRLDEPGPGGGILRAVEFPRGRLDLAEQVRDAGVVGFQLVHHGV